MDFTDLMAQMRRNTEASNGLLEDTRLVAAMGSRLALSLFVSAIRPGAQLVGAVTCEAAALQRLDQHQADLLLCTDQLEQGNGGSLVAAARQIRPQLRTLLIVTQPRRTAWIQQALQSGCDGLCLESNIGMGTVLQALTCVDLGAAYIDRDLRAAQLHGLSGLDGQPLSPLTPREREVLTLMSHSLNNQEIAQRLVISPETAKTHVQRILTKLQARDRLQAALQGIRAGLVEWPEPR
jgi:DNA-binding NarL/FixJ family response regulator